MLNLQNIGGPICEVFSLLCESGRKLKVLRLHDQDVKRIDRCYCWRPFHARHDSEYLDCPLPKRLVHICRNVRILSVDITPNGLEQGITDFYYRGIDFTDQRTRTLKPVLEETAQTPTRPVGKTLSSLDCLQPLRLVVLAWRSHATKRLYYYLLKDSGQQISSSSPLQSLVLSPPEAHTLQVKLKTAQ